MKSKLCFPALCALFAAAPASAIVNVEAVRNAELEQGLNGELGAAMNMISSDSDEVRVDVNARIDWLHGGTHDFAVAQGAYSELDGLHRRRGMLHLRHVQALNAPAVQNPYQTLYNWELFAQTARDDYASLRERSIVGAGVRLNRPFTPGADHALGFGVMSEWREMEADAGRVSTEAWRANLYLALRADWDGSVAVGSTIYLQPRLDDVEDFSAVGELFLDKSLSEQLSLRAIAAATRDSDPPAGVESSRKEYGLRIVYRFGG